MLKAMDIVKAEPKTEYEAWQRWMNRVESELRSMPSYSKRQIEVKEVYICIVCGAPNTYWWMYCQEHEAQCDREMDEATS